MTKTRHWKKIVIPALLWATLPGSTHAQMNMNPYFTAINYPIEKQSLMLMALPDFQVARYGSNFFTGMLMAEYGLTSRWTIGVMAEGQKIADLPATYGGWRFNTYIHVIEDNQWLNLTLYGEYEDLNGAALYKMEVAGFGSQDLTEPMSVARQTRVRTFEQRVIVYYDWDRLNATFNIIRETALQSPRQNDYGYALALFLKPSWMGKSTEEMPGVNAPQALSLDRLGYGVEIIGALGDDHQFGFAWNAQQHYLGAVFTYAISSHWSVRLEPAFGLSVVSDHFMLRTGVAYMFVPYSPNAMDGTNGH
jgi:hypothetical protein